MQGLLPNGTSRIEVALAYYLIASRYHSGQWSKGYAKLSQCVRMGLQANFNLEQDEIVRRHAAELLWKRRREIRKMW